MDVGGQADDVLAVVALDQAGHRARVSGSATSASACAAAALDGKAADLLHALHAVLRDLHLDLEGVAGGRVAPVVGIGEAGGGGGGDDGADDVGHRQAELSGALAVDRDVERREGCPPARTGDRGGNRVWRVASWIFFA